MAIPSPLNPLNLLNPLNPATQWLPWRYRSLRCNAPLNLGTFPQMTLENFPIFFYNKKKSINEQRRSFYETA